MENKPDISPNEIPAPWGLWATLGLSLVTIIAIFGIGAIVAIVYLVMVKIEDPNIDIGQFAQTIESDGFLLIISSWLITPICVGLILLFIKLRKGITVKEYLCLQGFNRTTFLKWGLVSIVFVAISDYLSSLLNRPLIPEFSYNIYTTAYSPPLLWLTLLVAAPVLEETFFRGFLFKGLQSSRIGTAGAVIISALAWAALHTQYDLYIIVEIFLGGLILGIVRYKTDSIYYPLTMHSLWNLISTGEVAIYLHYMHQM